MLLNISRTFDYFCAVFGVLIKQSKTDAFRNGRVVKSGTRRDTEYPVVATRMFDVGFSILAFAVPGSLWMIEGCFIVLWSTMETAPNLAGIATCEWVSFEYISKCG